MPQGIVGPQGVSIYSPSARESYEKIGKIDSTDGTTGVEVFGIPKGAFIAGVYTLSTGANTTQTITAGFSSGGNDLLTAFAPNSTGYSTAGSNAGASVGTQLSTDKTVFLTASAALTNAVFVKVEYWLPPVGQSY